MYPTSCDIVCILTQNLPWLLKFQKNLFGDSASSLAGAFQPVRPTSNHRFIIGHRDLYASNLGIF